MSHVKHGMDYDDVMWEVFDSEPSADYRPNQNGIDVYRKLKMSKDLVAGTIYTGTSSEVRGTSSIRSISPRVACLGDLNRVTD